MFDSDMDGVLTLDQVCQAIGVLGIRRSGWSMAFTTFHDIQVFFYRGGDIGSGEGSFRGF